jgi:hypothetical protein
VTVVKVEKHGLEKLEGRVSVEQGGLEGHEDSVTWGRFGRLQGEHRWISENGWLKTSVDKLTLISFMATIFSIPSSIISRTRPSNVRTKVNPFGRFLLCDPTTKSEASFFPLKNSSELTPWDGSASKGWMGFFLLKLMEWGSLRAC